MRSVVEVHIAVDSPFLAGDVHLASWDTALGDPRECLGIRPMWLCGDDDYLVAAAEPLEALDGLREHREIPEQASSTVVPCPPPELSIRLEMRQRNKGVPRLDHVGGELCTVIIVVAIHPTCVEVRDDAVEVDSQAHDSVPYDLAAEHVEYVADDIGFVISGFDEVVLVWSA